MGAYGRNLAIQDATARSARNAYTFNTQQLRDQLRIRNQKAYQAVGPVPMAPLPVPDPVYAQGPSQLGLYAGLAGNALSGFTTGMEVKQMFGNS